MAKIKTTFDAKLVSAGFSPGMSPEATFSRPLGPTQEDGFVPADTFTVPVDAKRLAKLLNVTDVEITVTVSPKGAKKLRKPRTPKATVAPTTSPATPVA